MIQMTRERTNVEGVVVAAQPEDDSLLRGGLVDDRPVGLAVLGCWLACMRSSNIFAELLSGHFCSEIERRRLDDPER